MINYILQVILFQVLFLAIYDFFLSKETFFTKNRWYLLTTPILSFLIPLIKIPTFQKAVSQEYIVQLPEIFLSPEKVIKRTFETTTFYESVNYINILFWVGVAVFSILFLLKLIKIINLIKRNKAEKISIFKLIFIPNKTNAFSFFNYIFLGKEIPVSQQEKIIEHEMVHSKQKHSLDLLLFEFLKIAMWFNPMIYFYQKRITLVHEYISDEIVSKKEVKEDYINNLLSNYFQVENVAFINQFYKKSLIKKRIIMMTKKQSKKMNQLKYLLLIPVLASMLFYTSCSEDTFKEDLSKSKLEKTTWYISLKNGEIKSRQRKNTTTYLDLVIGYSIPENYKEIAFKDLTDNEKNEFLESQKVANEKAKERGVDLPERIFLDLKNGRRAVFMKMSFNPDEEVEEKEEISFLEINKAPTFPGCESGDKDCFSLNIQKHFIKNFDATLPKTLGLSPGKKRVFISFKIDKEGNIVDVQARAPHEDIEQEVLSVMNSLPKVTPGEHEGKNVDVKYSIPFTIIVE
jgi:beta-lactamase regulating signal transducer with metallopeptidase domain